MKIAGSWASLLRGVSQQAPEARLPGQHEEQINLLSDPVAGLTRRQGSQYKAKLAVLAPAEVQIPFVLANANGYRKLEHSTGGKDYVLYFREERTARPLSISLPPIICYNKTDNVFLPILEKVAGTLEDLHLWGLSACVSLGKYVAFAHRDTPCGITTTGVFPGSVITSSVVWIRGGAYDRTYKVSWNGGANSASYTTPSASVAGAAVAISPQNIAIELSNTLNAAGATASYNGSHINITSPISATLAVSDGGDGGLIRGVGQDIDDASKLTLMGRNGQIVRIGYTPSNPGYYVKCVTKDGSDFGECVWREASGATRDGSTLRGVSLATIKAGVLEVGRYSSTAPTAGITGAPTFVSSEAGDLESNPTPKWMTGQIHYMGLFQDRLLIACNSALSISAAGDYFNFFRSTVVTVPLKDPFEMTAQGGEDDILRHGVSYNRNLVIFGDQKQYVISGTAALTPTSPNMAIMTVYPEAALCPPLAAGGQIYYSRNRDKSVALHQIQPGVYVDSAESFPASAQIGRYIPAPAADMVGVPGAPAQLIMRSRSSPRDLYVFSYLDQPDGRKQEAWGRWRYHEKCGNLIGVSNVPDGLILIWAREQGGTINLIADLQPVSAELSDLPYLDSARTIGATAAGTTDITVFATGWHMGFDKTTDRWLNGGRLEDREALQDEFPTEYPSAWVGLEYESSVVLTNPYIRDGEGKAVLTGRTVISRLLLNLKQSSGVTAYITTGNETTTFDFNGRVLGSLLNQIGIVPVSDEDHTIGVGRETREFKAKLSSRHWYPFTLVGIEWVGQSFNRTPRA